MKPLLRTPPHTHTHIHTHRSTLLLWVSLCCENLLYLGHSPCYHLQPLVSLTSGLRTLEDPGGPWRTLEGPRASDGVSLGGGPGAGQVSCAGLLPGAAPPPVTVLCLALTVCSQLDSFVQAESLQSGGRPSPQPRLFTGGPQTCVRSCVNMAEVLVLDF